MRPPATGQREADSQAGAAGILSAVGHVVRWAAFKLGGSDQVDAHRPASLVHYGTRHTGDGPRSGLLQ